MKVYATNLQKNKLNANSITPGIANALKMPVASYSQQQQQQQNW